MTIMIMKKALRYKNIKLRKCLMTQKYSSLFNKSLLSKATTTSLKTKFKVFKHLTDKETPKNICILTNKSRDVKRLLKLSGSSFKHYASHQKLAGFKKSSW